MDITTGVLVGLLLVLLYWMLSGYRSRNLPPGPLALPLLGSVPFLRAFRTKRHLLLSEVEEQYGRIIGVWIGTQLIVFLQGYDVIYDAFVQQGSVFSGRPNWLRSLQQGTEQGKGVIWQTGEAWATMRKFAIRTLRGFGVGQTTLEEKILHEVDTFTRALHEINGQPIVAKGYLKKGVTNIIHEIVFGSRFDHDDEKLMKLIDMVERFFQGGLLIPQNFLSPLLCSLFSKNQADAYRQKQVLIASIQSYIYEQIEEHEISFDDKNIRDFVDLYIQTCREGGSTERDGFTNGNIFRVIMDLFLAGAETTAGSLDWCLAYMIRHPEVQDRCYHEICQAVDTSRVHWSDRRKLRYTEATLMEIQRLATIAPFGVPHATTEPCTLGSYTIPVNTIVISNLYSVSRDLDYWDSPETFQPERHLDTDGNLRKNPAWVPFSLGPRVCLGENLARMELFLYFTNLLKNFQFISISTDETVTADVGEGKLTSLPTSYCLSALPRSESI